jgi:hypothetical protein
VLAGGHTNPHVDEFAPEILLVGEERGAQIGIDSAGLHLSAVDPQGKLDGGRGSGARTASYHAEGVLALGRKAIQRVHGVREAQARRVVRGGRLFDRLHGPGAWLPAHQRRLHGRHAENRRARHALGGHEVSLHQYGRQREHVGDVVEPVPGVVLGEIIGRREVYAEQIADRVVVLGPIEAANRDTARVCWGRQIGAYDLRVHPRGDQPHFSGGRARLVFRRHLASPDLEQHVLPRVRVREYGGGVLVAFQVEIALLPSIVVALVAVPEQERLHRAGENCLVRSWGSGARGGRTHRVCR